MTVRRAAPIALPFVALLLLALLPARVVRPGSGEASKDASEETEAVAGLRHELAALKKAFADFKEGGDRQGKDPPASPRTDLPVSAVVAFAGPWPPRDVKGKRWTEEELGWLLCDGRPLNRPEHAALRAVLGAGRLPDYRGYFLRGLDGSARIDKDFGRVVGSVQGYATALPTNPIRPFKTGKPSASPTYTQAYRIHEASLSFGRDQNATQVGFRERQPVEDSHTHTITEGGDAETRPVNVAVHWIIKSR